MIFLGVVGGFSEGFSLESKYGLAGMLSAVRNAASRLLAASLAPYKSFFFMSVFA